MTSLLVAVAALAGSVAAFAAPGGQPGRPAVPPGAVKIGEDTYSLGTRTVHGVEVEGIAYVHRARPARSGKKPGGGGGATCYSYLASGAKWLGVEPWSVDPTGAPVSNMASLLAKDIGTWEAAAGADIFGSGSTDSSYDADTSTVDDRNGAEFGPIADEGVIAVTYTWGVFRGPPSSRRLVEWDMIFDSDSFSWSTTGDASSMDFENIATHELGHAMGLGHAATSCLDETMYPYASLGETSKRDLGAGDIAGINGLY